MFEFEMASPNVRPFLISCLHFSILCNNTLSDTIFPDIFNDSSIPSPADIVIAIAEANLALPTARPSPHP